MWTNVFKIGGLQHVSWFQFLPCEVDTSTLSEKSVIADKRENATLLVLSAHLQLQSEGFLSTWTNSFVGPWDPSQGVYNPDEKIKLWLFLPGRYSSVVENAQAAVAKLRVVGGGLWSAPGNSEEIAAALSQTLRNRIERALKGLSYMRFGDAFLKYQCISHSEKQSRKLHLAVEFVFSATEEAVYVHAIICGKHVRALSSDDMECILRKPSNKSQGLSVVIAPHGMRGRLTGCCPDDLVRQVYLRINSNTSNGGNGQCVPLPDFSESSNYQVRGQDCYVEVTLGCPNSAFLGQSEAKKVYAEASLFSERIFICPAEMVFVPQVHRAFAKCSLRRLFLQKYAGSMFAQLWMLGSSSLLHPPLCRIGSSGDVVLGQHDHNSSNDSNSSSMSSTTSRHSDNNYGPVKGPENLEADADSVMSRQSGLSTNDTFEKATHKSVSKRLRTSEELFGPTDNAVSGPTAEVQICEDSGMRGCNSKATGVINEPLELHHWDWDDDDRGADMDIRTLLSEFGDFGDFFENDLLAFGEPPGMAESHALICPASEIGGSSASPVSRMDISDPALLSQTGFPVSSSSTQSIQVVSEEVIHRSRDTATGCQTLSYSSVQPSGKFDHLAKAEAMITFAPEYNAVETSPSESSLSVFRNPYLPKSQRADMLYSSCISSAYNANPPLMPQLEVSNGKNENNSAKAPGSQRGQTVASRADSNKYYMHVQDREDRQKDPGERCNALCEGSGKPIYSSSGVDSSNVCLSFQKLMSDSNLEGYLLSSKTVLATDVECILFQTAMCQIRHIVFPNLSYATMCLSRTTDRDQSQNFGTTKYEFKKREIVPVRIAGDVEGNIRDGGACNAPVGVWKHVEALKGPKLENSPSNVGGYMPSYCTFNDEGTVESRHPQSLLELLNAMPFLVQQATSFVDVTFDTADGDGPFDWLALEEQQRIGLSCGPSMVHAGCGGILAACHAFDIAGKELPDPLSSDVCPSSVISLLHSDVKIALESAFRDLEGPLLVTDWCKGRSQAVDAVGMAGDIYSLEPTANDTKDSASSISLAEEVSPSQSSTSSHKVDGTRLEERRANQEAFGFDLEQVNFSQLRPTMMVVPLPSILVGYQDDWLKTSAHALKLWEKAPLEPYALSKSVIYSVVCPDIDPLISATVDFFQQLGTVYETCRLGTHIPHQVAGGPTEVTSGKWLQSGFILIDCPHEVKVARGNSPLTSSIGSYLFTMSKNWDVRCYLDSLSKALENFKFKNLASDKKEGAAGTCLVIYVVCPFSEPVAVLQTLMESSAILGSDIFSFARDRSLRYSYIIKSLCSANADGASNTLSLAGFTLPRLVLQIVTTESIFGASRPGLNVLSLLKEIAFTVYNKARRVPRSAVMDVIQSSSLNVHSSVPGLWKDTITSRFAGASGDLDPGLRSGPWDQSWQSSRMGGPCYDSNRPTEMSNQVEVQYLFEPLFILAEPGSTDHRVPFNTLSEMSSSGPGDEVKTGGCIQTSCASSDTGSASLLEGPGLHNQTSASLHCCYGWTEDWRWLVCIWTDSRGELLDCHIFPFGGISSRQDTKGLQSLFVEILHQACQILACSSPDGGIMKPKDLVISRIGCFYELECQEWQKAIYFVGGGEVKKWWPVQLRNSVHENILLSSNGASLQQQDMTLVADRTVPSSTSSLYSQQPKSLSFARRSLGQSNARKHLLLGGQNHTDGLRGLLQCVQSITFIAVSVDHSLHLILSADASMSASGAQGGGANLSNYFDGISPVKSLGSTSVSYILIPSPSMKFLPPVHMQLPTCLTAESPPLAHLLHSKGSAIPLLTGFVVSRSVTTNKGDRTKGEWPSVLSLSLVDHYGGGNFGAQEKIVRESHIKLARGCNLDAKDYEMETHLILQLVGAEIHALSWMTISPTYLDRRTALPFHCDMFLRMRRLLHYADKEFAHHWKLRAKTMGNE